MASKEELVRFIESIVSEGCELLGLDDPLAEEKDEDEE
jgi:hypothetical protein